MYTQHINVKELVAICRWCEQLQNQRVIIYTDNKTAASWINKGSSRQDISMFVLRIIFWFCAFYNFSLKCVYFPGVHNVVADTCSRLHEPAKLGKLYDLIPSLQFEPFSIQELNKHMSLPFIFSRWGVKNCSPGYGRVVQKEGVG